MMIIRNKSLSVVPQTDSYRIPGNHIKLGLGGTGMFHYILQAFLQDSEKVYGDF